MKFIVLILFLLSALPMESNAQIKTAAQLSTLSPALLVVYSNDLENYQKNHFMISTIGYMGSYMILDSKWKAALLTLALGATKELVIDALLNKGTPLWDDMKWNTLGVGQGIFFTIAIDF